MKFDKKVTKIACLYEWKNKEKMSSIFRNIFKKICKWFLETKEEKTILYLAPKERKEGRKKLTWIKKDIFKKTQD